MSDTLTETPAVETQEQSAAVLSTEEQQAPVANETQEGQSEQQSDFDSQLHQQIEDVNLDNFDLDDLEDYQEALKDLTVKKRKAYDQAKKERLAKEALQKEIDELRRNQKMAENDELEALRLQLQEKERAHQEAMQELQNEKSRQADLMFNHAAEIHNAKEKDFLRFKLGEHLKSNSDLENFNVSNWMSEMKTNHPAMFAQAQAEQQRKPANTTNNTQASQPAAGSTYQSGVADKVSTSPKDKRQRDSEWEAYKQKNNLA
jgi:hypothetical protein